MTDAEKENLGRLRNACDEMAALIRDYQIPTMLIRRLTSLETAEFILEGERLERL